MIGERAGVTIVLGLISMVVVLVVGVLLGVAAALRPGTRLDRAAVMFGVLGDLVPGLRDGCLLLYVFGVVSGGSRPSDPATGLVDRLWHLALPAPGARPVDDGDRHEGRPTAVIEELGKDYVAFARSRETRADPHRVAYVLRNALGRRSSPPPGSSSWA